ncbi:MAG: RNA 3'-terminal-phosphate cyclase [Candidatus Bathyarchaeota archaeon BA1]|nr:MAG: RNA 3'-terminal-phosphate cyclase [Candidatus Bathyarchaeota archaeon BA1]
MLEIDGSQKSGSGTILRLSIALAGILGEPLHLYNIRQKRSEPGLRPQHLEAVLTAAKLCNAELRGAALGSRELWFKPSGVIGGEIRAEIGTAGSIPMLLLTILPLCVFAKRAVRLHVVRGGTDVRNAPTINYLKHVLLFMLERMGLRASLTIQKYGYYPKGMGEVSLEVQPCQGLIPLRLENFGTIEELCGVSVCTFLADRRVAERQAKAANEYLGAHGYEAKVQVVNDMSNPLQKGSSLVLWAKSDAGALLGGDAIGELRKPSEVVGKEAAENLVRELETQATVDVHLADMLVPYAALADGNSAYLTRTITDHLDTNVWLAQEILGVKFHVTRVGNLYRVEKFGP